MRIKNAYVEGYLGLLEGTGRNELSVDFAPAHEAGLQRIMLFGRNGWVGGPLHDALGWDLIFSFWALVLGAFVAGLPCPECG